MAGYGGKREGAGRPNMRKVWRWCVAQCLEMRADRAEDLRDPLDTEERTKVNKAKAKLAELDDLNKLPDLGDLRKKPLELRADVIAFADRYEKIADAGCPDVEDVCAEVLAEAGPLRPYCEALLLIRSELDPGGDAPYSRLHRSANRRRRPVPAMDGIDGVYELVADAASKEFELRVKATSVKRQWKRYNPLINRAIRYCCNDKT